MSLSQINRFADNEDKNTSNRPWDNEIVWDINRKDFKATKIIIQMLAPHFKRKSISPGVVLNTTNMNSVTAISVHLMYTTNRGMRRVEHNKIRHRGILLKLLVCCSKLLQSKDPFAKMLDI